MAIKRFYFSQLADLRIEGVGIHASYAITLIVNEEDNNNGKRISVSALGKSNAVKAAGSGKLLFWCVITNNLNHKKYILEMKKGESWAMGVDDIPIGSVDFDFIKSAITPELTVEFGYIYDAGYTGSVVPFPRSSTKTIKLNKFKW